jgi:hypothetical protein
MSDERLDRLIDEVAKQLTAGQPSSDFRARVIASLDRHPGRTWWTSWIAVPLGAVAVVTIAIAVARPFNGRDRGAESPAPGQSSQAAKKETAPVSPTPDTATVRLPPSPGGFSETGKADTTYEGPRGTRGAAADRRRDPLSAAGMIEALAPPPLEPPSIGVQALGIDRLPIESIAITELDAIIPIAVEPLPTGDERPASGQRPSPNDRNE